MAQAIESALPYLKASISPDETAPVFPVAQNDSPVVTAFTPVLSITYVLDEPGALVFVRERDLGRTTKSELHAMALENLRARAKTKLHVERRGPVAAVLFDGRFEASTLLLDSLWDEQIAAMLEGEIVVATPARDVLIAASATSSEGRSQLHGIVSRLHPGGDHLLVPQLHARRDGSWETIDA